MDSKISQLPSANKIYDGDLLVVVTGYNTAGSYPDNVKINCELIRRDIVRLNEMLFLLSGFSGYYNSDNNTMTITTHQKEGNLVKLDYEPTWPYMQIIHTTGLNINSGEGVGYSVNNSFPYGYELKNMNRAKQGSSITIANNTSLNSSVSGYSLLNLSYNDFFISRPNSSIKLLCESLFKINNLTFNQIPFVSPSGQIDDRKYNELLNLNNVSHNYQYNICNIETNTLQEVNNTKVFNTGDFKDFEPISANLVIDTFTLTIGISGGSSPNFINQIHTYPITFKNRNGVNANNCSEIYRSGLGKDIFNSIPTAIDPILIEEPVTLFLSSSGINNNNSLALYATISNVQYIRNYRYLLTNSATNCLGNTIPIYFTFNTTNTYCTTNATIEAQFLKTKYII